MRDQKAHHERTLKRTLTRTLRTPPAPSAPRTLPFRGVRGRVRTLYRTLIECKESPGQPYDRMADDLENLINKWRDEGIGWSKVAALLLCMAEVYSWDGTRDGKHVPDP